MTAEQIKQYIFISIITLTVFLNGCSSYTIFNTSKEGQRIKPGSIVVIAGSPEEADIRLAELFSEYLAKNTKFTVVSQETVFKKMPAYPLYSVTDKMSKSDSKKNNSPWIPEDMKANLSIYQQKFKTEYILLVWADHLVVSSGNAGTSYWVDFMSRLIDVSSNNVIGYSSYTPMRGSCVGIFFSVNRNIDKMLESVSEDVVDEMVKKTLGE